MKRLFILLLVSLFVLASRSSVSAQTNMCNQSCDVDSDCGRGYRCYVGVCRLDACPAVSSCVCNSAQVTPAPTATPLVARTPTPKPSATPTPTPRPSVVPTATVSAVPMTTPKTGFNAWAIAGISILMFFAGSSLMAKEKMADMGSLSPQELVNKRKSSRA